MTHQVSTVSKPQVSKPQPVQLPAPQNVKGPVDVDPQDPWVTTRNGYREDKIYTRATDGHGHSELIHVKLSPALAAALREAKDVVPEYRTLADIVRDALIHRLHAINKWSPDHINLQPIDTEVAIAARERIDAGRAMWKEMINNFKVTVNALIDEGDYESAQYLIDEHSDLSSMTLPYQMEMGSAIQSALQRMNGGRLPN